MRLIAFLVIVALLAFVASGPIKRWSATFYEVQGLPGEKYVLVFHHAWDGEYWTEPWFQRVERTDGTKVTVPLRDARIERMPEFGGTIYEVIVERLENQAVNQYNVWVDGKKIRKRIIHNERASF